MKERLSDSIDQFTAYRRLQVSKPTQRADTGVLVAFLTLTGNIYTDNVEEAHVSSFLVARSATRSANSLGQDVTKLRTFFEWASRNRRIRPNRNPMAGIKAPKVLKRERDRVPVSLFPTLLDAAGETCPRDRAFVALCLFTLCRTSEIQSIRLADLDLGGGRIKVTVHKKGIEDYVPIDTNLDRELRRWLTAYTAECGPLQPEWYLTPSRRVSVSQTGTRTLLTPSAPIVWSSSMVKRALHGASWVIPGNPTLKGEGAHTLRRSAARAMYDWKREQGYDHAMRLVQVMLHHENLEQTERYIGMTYDKKLRDVAITGEDMFGLSAVTPIGSRHEAEEDGYGVRRLSG